MTLNKKYRRLKNAGHVLFWLASIVFALSIFYVVSDYRLGPGPDMVIRAIIINTGFVFAVYTNFYLLIPYFLKRRNYIFYAFWLIITLAVSSLIIITLCFLVQQQPYTRDLFSTHFFTSFAYVAVTSLAKFFTDWIELQDISLRYNKIEREKLEAELNTLKAQINPHFLFNSLNNIYSLSLVNSAKTPAMILKLADLMRHVLYESRENFVPLKQEIEFIRNFIDLQKIRTSDHAGIRVSIQATGEDRLVIPLIFEPFLDNAFKYGPRSFSGGEFIDISVRTEGEWLLFSVLNTCCSESEKKDHAHGIGLNNVRQRLAFLLKKEDYELEISKKENIFTVHLTLRLK